MSKTLVNIDEGLFLEDYATFEKIWLPLVNKERREKGEPILEGEEAMDFYLDLINEHKKDMPDEQEDDESEGADNGTICED